MYAHLGGGVKRQVGRNLARKTGDSHVLHDKRVRVGFGGEGDCLGKLSELVVKYNCVERYIKLYAVDVAVGDGSFQLVRVKIMG